MNASLLIVIGLVTPFFLIKYREQIGDTIGEADWMRWFGGVYIFITIVAIVLFFWALAETTGTTNILFKPVIQIFPKEHMDSSAPVMLP